MADAERSWRNSLSIKRTQNNGPSPCEWDALLTGLEKSFIDAEREMRMAVLLGRLGRDDATAKARACEVTTLQLLSEVRTSLHVAASGDREELRYTFGGDCNRIARVRTMLDAHLWRSISQCVEKLPPEQEAIRSCQQACVSIEAILRDLGYASAMQSECAKQLVDLSTRRDKECQWLDKSSFSEEASNAGNLDMPLSARLGRRTNEGSAAEPVMRRRRSIGATFDVKDRKVVSELTGLATVSCDFSPTRGRTQSARLPADEAAGVNSVELDSFGIENMATDKVVADLRAELAEANADRVTLRAELTEVGVLRSELAACCEQYRNEEAMFLQYRSGVEEAREGLWTPRQRQKRQSEVRFEDTESEISSLKSALRERVERGKAEDEAVEEVVSDVCAEAKAAELMRLQAELSLLQAEKMAHRSSLSSPDSSMSPFCGGRHGSVLLQRQSGVNTPLTTIGPRATLALADGLHSANGLCSASERGDAEHRRAADGRSGGRNLSASGVDGLSLRSAVSERCAELLRRQDEIAQRRRSTSARLIRGHVSRRSSGSSNVSLCCSPGEASTDEQPCKHWSQSKPSFHNGEAAKLGKGGTCLMSAFG
eukprot:TRINITY_DN50595_c0_g1_i1.p1 TRINITY_DN50595_c0_g1~~TRINITY_DN50595_c0_g1_i1.p1  ORF type:complete len:613 (+),score=93.75 TRINITY_DN50595_c0_g1_i1:43-1839(+)